MKFRKLSSLIALAPFTLVLIAANLAAQDDAAQAKKAQHHHYMLIDIGTFGGPASYFPNGFDGILNNRGTAADWADTSTPDPLSSVLL